MQKNDPTLERQPKDSMLDSRRVKAYSLNQLKKNVKRRSFESSRDNVGKKATEALNENEEERTEARTEVQGLLNWTRQNKWTRGEVLVDRSLEGLYFETQFSELKAEF